MDVRPTPNILWRLFVLIGVGLLSWLSVDDRAWSRVSEATGDAVPRRAVRGAVVVTAVLHLLEALVVGRRARRAGLDRPGRWARSALVYGFPVVRRLSQARRDAAGGSTLAAVEPVAAAA